MGSERLLFRGSRVASHVSWGPSPGRCSAALHSKRSYSQVPGGHDANPGSRLGGIPPKAIPDCLSPTPSRLLNISVHDALGRNQRPDQLSGQHLPEGHHLVYFPIQTAPSGLMPDGTDPDHWPGGQFSRRMWTGGEVTFGPSWKRDMQLDGRAAVCVESVCDVRTTSEGASRKIWVDVWRHYGIGGTDDAAQQRVVGAPAIQERRTLCFMGPRDRSDKDKAPRILKVTTKPDHAISLTPSRTLLFNFSALTYNAHRIHIDAAYATVEEGYRGLLVHGPLTLVLMFEALRGPLEAAGGSVRRLTYRNLAPLYCDEPMRVCVRRAGAGTWEAWIEGPDAGLAVKATAEITERDSLGG